MIVEPYISSTAPEIPSPLVNPTYEGLGHGGETTDVHDYALAAPADTLPKESRTLGPDDIPSPPADGPNVFLLVDDNEINLRVSCLG